jgi:hypothetical protein
VGKEPLVDDASVTVCRTLISKAVNNGMSVSLITNGINLQLLGNDILDRITFVDISLDGGSESYLKYRGTSIAKITDGVRWLRENNFYNYNALEVLNDRTVFFVDDMMDYAISSGFSKIMFSPYVATESQGTDTVTVVTLEQCLSHLRDSALFMKSHNAFFIIDAYHCLFEGISFDNARKLVESEGLSHKSYFVPSDPTDLGIIRITYDGLVLSSFDALHTSWYEQKGIPLRQLPDLHQHYRRLLSKGLPKSYMRAA